MAKKISYLPMWRADSIDTAARRTGRSEVIFVVLLFETVSPQRCEIMSVYPPTVDYLLFLRSGTTGLRFAKGVAS